VDSKEGAKDYVGIRKAVDGQSLGELEAQVLDVIWDLPAPVSTTQVFKVIYPKRELAYSTIMLTMGKMARKGFLKQEKTGETKTAPFMYTPLITREEMGMKILESVSQIVFRKPLKEVLDSGLLEK